MRCALLAAIGWVLRGEYGTFILARVPLASLTAQERGALEAALRSIYQLEVGALTSLKTVGCANQRPSAPFHWRCPH
ncbi:MAG TPA: hypothetical protein VGK67_33510 [Myxococcales bacterium]|jgi:hypothetical protein